MESLGMAELGWIGLGTMGGRIVRRLLDAGHQVSGFNRTRSKAEPLVRAGMQWSKSPRAVAEQSEITFSMVSDSAALWAVAEGPEGVLAGLSPNKVFVDMSTVSPRLSRQLAERVSGLGAHMLDAPVSGSVPAAEGGTLVIYVGGELGVLERVRPVLEVMGQNIIHVGQSGQAIATKIAINLSLAPQLVSLFEGLMLAERCGVPREKALQSILDSVVASPAMKYRAPLILEPPHEVWFNVAMMQKDLQLALELGRELNVPLLNASLANELLTSARSLGYAEQDFSAIFAVLERLAGTARH
jgi:3-hydroxyisobutyrate dehydrogenase-like beta-hydroxyacid dehydrogenase